MKLGVIAALLAVALAAMPSACAADWGAGKKQRTITGTVEDALGHPLAGVKLGLKSAAGKTVVRSTTDRAGKFYFRQLAPGIYAILARRIGFKPATVIVPVTAANVRPVKISMESAQALNLPVIAARLNRARNSLSPETGSTVYRFSDKNINELPQGDNTPFNNVLIQAPGVSQDSYGQGQGQIHIHGFNGGGIQYRLNGIFLPEAVSSFGELFSPYFINSVSLIDNFMPAQFGYRNEGVVDIHTKDGCLEPGGRLEYYGGQRGTIQPSLTYGGCAGNLSYYFSGFYLQSALGVQSPTRTPTPEHDVTNQGQGFGYLSYFLSPTTRLSIVTGTAINGYQVPGQPDLPVAFPISGVTNYPNSADTSATEFEQNYFGILALQGTLGSKLDYQLAYFSRYYSLEYDPDPIADLAYNGIADRVLHTGFINGAQEDTSYRLTKQHTLQGGFYVSGETLEEDNHALVFHVSNGLPGTIPETVVDNFNGKALLLGVYAQDQWRPTEKLELTIGARLDAMDYFGWQTQLSPRLGAVYKLTPTTTLNAGYARYFQVPPFESVLLKTVNKFANTTGASGVTSGNQKIKAEDDEFFDAGVTQQLPLGLSASLEGFFMWSTDKFDLAQFGSTYIFAPLQYAHGRVWGADFSLVKSTGGLSAYFNFSYTIAQAENIIAGQFFAGDPEEVAYVAHHWIYLDDNQEFTSSAGLSYRLWGFSLMVDGIWGNGYHYGFANLKTQLPYIQVNAAIARNLAVPKLADIEGRLSVVNLFDHVYLIRQGSGIGVFSPQYGPRRALYFTLTVPLGAARTANQTS
jgi:outer membrane receptor protein involved in Fe transport